MSKTIQIDAIGDACPIPVVKTKRALAELTEEGIVITHVDNEIAVQNLTKMAKQKGLSVSAQKIQEREFAVTIKTDAVLMPDETEPVCQLDARENLVVAIGSAQMGDGDEVLGKLLMKGFLYAVSRLEQLPKTVLFYNGGASIPVEGSESLEDLRFLEAQGVSIKTCGTCLNHYGLTDRLAVGEVTNMYEIAELLAKADRIVKP